MEISKVISIIITNSKVLNSFLFNNSLILNKNSNDNRNSFSQWIKIIHDYALSISIIIHTIRFSSIKHLTYTIILDINILCIYFEYCLMILIKYTCEYLKKN